MWVDLLRSTNTDLLNGLRDPQNHAAWSEFCARYGPILSAFASRLGLAGPDVEDATQEAFIAFAGAYREGRYKQKQGRLRSWLFGIVQHKVRDIQRRQAREPTRAVGPDEATSLHEAVDEGNLREIWEEEWRQAVIRTCLDLVRRDVTEKTFAAFEGITLRESSPADVAVELGMSRAAVTKANQRVLSRMRELHQIVDSEW